MDLQTPTQRLDSNWDFLASLKGKSELLAALDAFLLALSPNM